MKNFAFPSLSACLSLTSSGDQVAQEIWQVDSRVKLSMHDTGRDRTLHVNVEVDNDDMARSPKLIVTLPRNCQVTAIKLAEGFELTPYQIMGHDNFAIPQPSTMSDSYVQFDIRNMNREAFDVDITFVPTKGKFRQNSQAAAFIYNITPEANKKNNYAVIDVH